MKKDILIVAHFTQVPGEKGNSRFEYILNMLVNNKHDIELVTTNFSHRTKKHRVLTNQESNQSQYKLTMLSESGYKKNVSLQRFYSHYIFGRNLKKYLKNRKKPDVIYCAVPSLDSAYVVAKYASKNNIKFIIDIQDVWPEAFKMVFNIPLLSNILFYPMSKKADYIYKAANEIVAVSETYTRRALSVNKKCEGRSVFLGTDLSYFDKVSQENLVNKPMNEIWIAYIGTLGHSYDLNCVIDALSILKEDGINNIKFVVMGDGPLKSDFQHYAKTKKVWIEFTGRLNYEEMTGILRSCDFSVNPIKANSAGSIINKVGDYAAAGLAVLNTQESDEYRKLIKEYKAGFNCKNDSPEDLASKILLLYKDERLRNEMGKNNRMLANDMFNRSITYKKIVELLVH
ncbi:glycosyltransferase family 4 protein [Priestia flexa]|uniref:glycosyltransferase family 4 protein n=1 Tax=Priestia flexa TaxID=86664 RepID=UPI001B341D9F|nr:glycosyltransferase family 4 protein [Priestia flexa]